MPHLLSRLMSCFAGWPHRPPPRAERVPGAPRADHPEQVIRGRGAMSSRWAFQRTLRAAFASCLVQGERGFRIQSF